ncbi:PAS domain S-box protein [Natronomonas sp. CBA1123]|uniref:PAS domain S-box protein n=1 Tax=Natronomonas sp. CBA1123 TaxID=2668070 RepID=UPI0012EA589A|nr:PAS domain S-box protein [Natronomonas sp. CBA1123]MUV87154.1 PAS domain S-box protein [Natronomonas sp. CBA1123]
MDDPEKLRALLDHAQDKIVVIDENGVYRYVNAAVERLLGYTTEEFVGTNTFEYMHPDDREDVREAFGRLLEGAVDDIETIEYRHQAKDGSWVWLESRVENHVDSTLGGYVVSSRDITDRKRAERRQRETEIRLEELAANTDDVLWTFSEDWSELLFVNDAFEDLWGMPVERVKADPTSFLDGIHPDDRDRVLEAMHQLSNGTPRTMEYRVNPEKGYRRWVWVQARPVAENGSVARIVGFARDVTDRRRRERQLQVMDNLLRHNLRNDMNVILGHAELARKRADGTVVEGMETILETGWKLLETAEKEREIVDVLVGVGDVGRVDLASTLRDKIEEFGAEMAPEATITADTPASAEVVSLPEIDRAIHELLENAIRHADGPPDIEAELHVESEDVILNVRDNASPIPRNEFEPLFGDEEPSDLYHGTGLGLWLVYWIVDLSEGTLDFEYVPDCGNCVTVRLPRAE